MIDLPLLRLDAASGRIAGEYRAVVYGSRVLHVRVPHDRGAHILVAGVGHSPGPIVCDTQGVMLTLAVEAGQSVPFEVRWDTQADMMLPDLFRGRAQPMMEYTEPHARHHDHTIIKKRRRPSRLRFREVDPLAHGQIVVISPAIDCPNCHAMM